MANRRKKPITTKTEEIRAWFESCDPEATHVRDALKRAAKMLWARQTIAEQDAGETRDDNGVGYNAYDAQFAYRIVNWRGMLTPKMAFGARKMLKKYARQLAEIALAKEMRCGV